MYGIKLIEYKTANYFIAPFILLTENQKPPDTFHMNFVSVISDHRFLLNHSLWERRKNEPIKTSIVFLLSLFPADLSFCFIMRVFIGSVIIHTFQLAITIKYALISPTRPNVLTVPINLFAVSVDWYLPTFGYFGPRYEAWVHCVHHLVAKVVEYGSGRLCSLVDVPKCRPPYKRLKCRINEINRFLFSFSVLCPAACPADDKSTHKNKMRQIYEEHSSIDWQRTWSAWVFSNRICWWAWWLKHFRIHKYRRNE